jgi:mRNA interferase HigB
MHIITKKHLNAAGEKYRDAASEIRSWYKIASAANWQNFQQMRQTFPDVDSVDGYVIFNIRHNRYRLVTIIRYPKTKDGRATQGRIYIRSFLTHKEYDDRKNWDKGVI